MWTNFLILKAILIIMNIIYYSSYITKQKAEYAAMKALVKNHEAAMRR